MANSQHPGQGSSGASRPKIAVFSGATATIQNSPPLITSNKARAKYGLPILTQPDGRPLRFDVLRAQRLAAPATVYVEQFSAHPLERDAAALYAPPDGYLDEAGVFHRERTSPNDVPVYEIVLRPEDGLYPLPYMARQASGQPWDDDGASPLAPAELSRQPFYPDASRLFEEIDRFGIGEAGTVNLLSSRADFDFYRAAPSGGYKQGLAAPLRTDVGEGDIPPEVMGEDFFGYRPRHLRREPPMPVLARLTNVVQRALASGRYAGAIWLEGSPFLEETAYWFNLLIDTTVPICGNAAQRFHGMIGNEGDKNIVDSVSYICSRAWADEAGRDSVGVVLVQDEQIFAARDVQKADARPGGYVATGGHGGIIGSMGGSRGPILTYRPLVRHTYRSAVCLSRLPASVEGVLRGEDGLARVKVGVKNERGELLETAIPKVTIVKHARYLLEDSSREPGLEVEILARLERNLERFPLAGFVAEGAAPYGSVSESADAALRLAAFSGLPVVKVGRGNAEGMTPAAPGSFWLSGNNLTATKARLLLMACLLRFGSLPPARDPSNPTEAERQAVLETLSQYQAVFDSH